MLENIFIVFNKPIQPHGTESLFESVLLLSYLEPASSLMFSIKSSTYPHPEPDESSPRPFHPNPLKSTLILSSLHALFFQMFFPFMFSQQKPYEHLYSLPCVQHALPIASSLI